MEFIIIMRIQREGDYGEQDYRICGRFQVGVKLKGPNELTITALNMDDLTYYEKKITNQNFINIQGLQQHFYPISELGKYLIDENSQYTFDKQTQVLMLQEKKNGKDNPIQIYIPKQDKFKYQVILARLCRLSADIKRNQKSSEDLRVEIRGLKLPETGVSSGTTSNATIPFNTEGSSAASYERVLKNLQEEIDSLKVQIGQSSAKTDQRFEAFFEQNRTKIEQEFNRSLEKSGKIINETVLSFQKTFIVQSDKKIKGQIKQIFCRLNCLEEKVKKVEGSNCDIKAKMTFWDRQIIAITQKENRLKVQIDKEWDVKLKLFEAKFVEIGSDYTKLKELIFKNLKNIAKIETNVEEISIQLDSRFRKVEGSVRDLRFQYDQTVKQSSKLSEKLIGLQDQVGKISATIAQLTCQIGCCEGRIKGCEQKFCNFNVRIEAISQQITVIQFEAILIKGSINNIDNTVTKVPKTNSCPSDSSGSDSSITSINNSIKEIQIQISKLKNFESTINITVANSASITQINTKIANIEKKIAPIMVDIGGLKGGQGCCCQTNSQLDKRFKDIEIWINKTKLLIEMTIKENSEAIQNNTKQIKYNESLFTESQKKIVETLTKLIAQTNNNSVNDFNLQISDLQTLIKEASDREIKFHTEITQKVNKINSVIMEKSSVFGLLEESDTSTKLINNQIQRLKTEYASLTTKINTQASEIVDTLKKKIEQQMQQSGGKCSCGCSGGQSPSANIKNIENILKDLVGSTIETKFATFSKDHKFNEQIESKVFNMSESLKVFEQKITEIPKRSSDTGEFATTSSQLEARIAAVEEQNESFENRLTSLVTSDNEIKDNIVNAKTNIAIIQVQITSLTDATYKINESLGSLRADLSTLRRQQGGPQLGKQEKSPESVDPYKKQAEEPSKSIE